MKRRVPVIYHEGDTVVHRRDPRAKLVAFAVLMLFLYLAPTWEWMLAFAVLGLGMAVVARVPAKWLAVLLALQVPQMVTYVGWPAIMRLLAGRPPLQGDFSFGLKIALSWPAALFISASVFTTMELTEMTDGLRGLGVPELAVFTLEYVFLLFYVTISDLYRIMDAMKVKGVRVETKNPVTLARNIPKFGIPMILAVLRRANTMMAVLKMRGYSFSESRELRTDLKFDAGDAALVAGAVALVGFTALVRVGLYEFDLVRAAGRAFAAATRALGV